MTVPFAALGSAIIGTFGAPALIQVERRSGGTLDQATGLWTSGALSTLSMDAAVMPAKPSAVAMLPDNARSESMVSVFTREPLQLPDTSAGLQADVIIYRGQRYLVQFVEPWSVNAGFSHAMASRMDG